MPKAVWMSTTALSGWACSDCEWSYPAPTLLTGSEGKSAYDRLAMAKFRDHKCAEFPARASTGSLPSVTERIRSFAASGYKPKDAIQIVLQEVQLESRGKPAAMEAAEAEAQEFLRRMREGII